MTARPKFMLVISESHNAKLRKIAKRRGVNLQELIRAVVIPDWLRDNGDKAENR